MIWFFCGKIIFAAQLADIKSAHKPMYKRFVAGSNLLTVSANTVPFVMGFFVV